MKILKINPARKFLPVAAVFFAVLTVVTTARAQYETSLTTNLLTENFDELSVSSVATLPAGWVFAQGVTLPTYGATLTCQAPPFQFLAATTNNCQNCTRSYDGGTSGGTGNTATPTGGARVNYGDATGADRSIGFMSLNSSTQGSTTDYRSPTNYIMFGFTNNTGSNIISFAVTNNIKMFRQSSSASFATAVKFYYSYDGASWTAFSGGNVGPFPSGTTTYYFNSPVVSNASFTISGLNVSNNAPFYVAWQFVIASANGSFSAGLGLDDVGLTATYGVGAPPVTSVWTNSSGNWNVAANWRGSTLPASGNSLSFAGAGGNSTNNLATVSTGTGAIGSLNFTNGAGGYTLSGNAVSLTSGLTNNSSATQAVNLPLTLLGDETFAAASGSLIFANVITNGGFGLTFAGASNFTLNGSVTGSGALAMAGSGTLLLNGSNTYAGSTTINGGTLLLGGSEKIPDGSAVAVATGATFDLNNFNETVGSLGGGGNVNLGNATLTLASAAAGSFSGLISGNGGINKIGSGIFTVSSTNNYHGNTYLSAGIIAVPATGNLGDSTLVLNGGTFQCTGTRDVTNGILPSAISVTSNSIIQNTTSATAGTRNLPFGGALFGTNGTLTIQNIVTGNFTNVLHLRIYGAVTNFSLPIVFDNSLAASPVNNTCQLGAYNTNGSAPQLYSGNISGPGRFFRSSIYAGGGGVAILTGSNTFTLGTTVNRGYLGLGADTYSSGGVLLAGPVGTGTLEIDDDTVSGQPGVGIFAYGGARVIENRVLLNGVTNAVIGGTNNLTLAGIFDLGGVPKILTVSNTAVTTISGQFTNTATFTKAGPGLLALTADNSQFWTGPFTITGGTVAANNPIGSATGTNTLTITGGSLSGTGYVASAAVVTSGGSIMPGYTVGKLTLQNGLDLSGGGALLWNLGANSTSNPGTDFSQLALTGGSLNLGGSSILTLAFVNSATVPASSNPFWQTNHAWRIATLAGGATINGTIASISNGSYAAGNFATITDVNGLLLTYTASVVSVTPPVIGKVSLSGSLLSLYLTNGSVGSAFQIVTATNLTQTLATWALATNGTFAGNGTSTNAISINLAEPKRFYRVKQ